MRSDCFQLCLSLRLGFATILFYLAIHDLITNSNSKKNRKAINVRKVKAENKTLDYYMALGEVQK